MKAVQVGILVALLICAGLLYKVYRGQQTAPAAAPAQPVAAATPSPEAPAATPAPVASAPVQAAPAQAPSPRRPSHSAVKTAGELAENREPVSEPAPPAMPAAQPAPAQAPPLQPAPEPEPPLHPGAVLNPPPGAEAAPPAPRQPQSVTIPEGTLITVRLADSLSGGKNHAGDPFSATLDRALVVDGFAVAERGAQAEGKVLDTGQGGKDLTLQLTRLHTSDGQDVAIATEKFTREGTAATGKQSGEKVAAGAVLGAVIGAIAGGGKGAAIGAGAGGAAGGGVAAATHRKPAELPIETRLTFRLAQPVQLTERTQ